MNVTVQFFASYADRLGRSATDITLPEGSTVADMLRCIGELPGAAQLPPHPMVAVNLTYAAPATVLHRGDEIAVIPPVAGG